MQVIVCEIYAYHGPSVADVVAQVNDANQIYEHPRFVVAAETLDELPHPSQDPAVRDHFGDEAVPDEELALAALTEPGHDVGEILRFARDTAGAEFVANWITEQLR